MQTENENKSVSKSVSSPELLCSQIKVCLNSSAAELMSACELIVALVDSHKWFPDKIANQLGVSLIFIRNLERVGRKRMAPELIWGETQGRRCLARLPIEEQTRWLAEPLELITSEGDELQVSVDSLTPELCRQVFDGGRVRTTGEQRAWLETAQRIKRIAPAIADFEVSGRTLIVHNECRLTRAQVARVLADMED